LFVDSYNFSPRLLFTFTHEGGGLPFARVWWMALTLHENQYSHCGFTDFLPCLPLVGETRRQDDVVVVRSGRVLTLSEWHSVRVGRYRRKLYLWVDGMVNYAVLQPSEGISNFDNLIYFGMYWTREYTGPFLGFARPGQKMIAKTITYSCIYKCIFKTPTYFWFSY